MVIAPKVMLEFCRCIILFLVATVDFSLGLKNIAKREGSHNILVVENLPELSIQQIKLK